MSLVKEIIAENAAKLVESNDIVILGIGIPTLCLKYIYMDAIVISENGVIGISPNNIKKNIIDAGRNNVGLKSGGGLFDSSTAFEIIRGGRLDKGIVGALEVDYNGNIACHSGNDRLFGYGGALDIYTGAKKVIATVQHFKFKKLLGLPESAHTVVDIVVTEKGIYEI